MVRRTPSSEITLLFHPAILVVPLLAVAAFLLALCASHQRKSSLKQQSPSPPPSSAPCNKLAKNIEGDVASEEQSEMPLPPLPALKYQQEEQCSPPPPPPMSVAEKKASVSKSKRKLPMSRSMRIAEGLTKFRTSSTKQVEKASVEVEESSVWTKTIILGERCRIPSDEEDENVAIYDDKGHRRRNYHPRTPRSLPISRTNSSVSASSARTS